MKGFSVLAATAGATLCAIFAVTSVFESRQITGYSMAPTLLPGSRIFINKAAYGLKFGDSPHYILRWAIPSRGDLIVYRNPEDGILVIKRCIGIDGDLITVGNGSVSVAGTELPVSQMQKAILSGYGSVPPGMLFAAGDSSANSVDSRDYGFIGIEKVLGKVIRYTEKKEAGNAAAGSSNRGIVAGDD